MQNTMSQNAESKSWLNIKGDFNTMTWVLIPVAIALNIAIGQIVVTLKLPVFLDSVGTILVAVLCGPWAGALTGALSNTIWGIAIDPNAFPWWPVALSNVTHYSLSGFAELVQPNLPIRSNGLCTVWLFVKLLSLALRRPIFPFSPEIAP